MLEESAMRKDGSSFRDYEIHKYLRNKGIKNTDGEWFTCSVKDVQAAPPLWQRQQIFVFNSEIEEYRMS